MKHAVIFAHPVPQSFTGSVASAYAKAVGGLGHSVVVRDLYGIGFDPCLKARELPFASDFQIAPDIAQERDLLKDCDVFALFYPLWLNTLPAILKGYLERVFGFGFAYGAGGQSCNPLLNDRKLISFTSSGAPAAWVKRTGAWQTQFDDYFAELCGLSVLDHVHIGAVTPGASAYFIQARLEEVANVVNTHFRRPS